MPRMPRVFLPGYIYHLTHRCHNGCFFLGTDRMRREYRRRLHASVRRFKICMLNYCITSNHTHLLIKSLGEVSISVFMQHLEGEFGSHYNRAKGRSGAFWNGRFHVTVVETGTHFWNCMRYIDLNMVRARVVGHPTEWPWCGYQEISGRRRRYRILDLEELPRLAVLDDYRVFAEWYDVELEKTLRAGDLRRVPQWTESIAVGSEQFVRRVASMWKERKKLEFKEWINEGWYVCESSAGLFRPAKRRDSSRRARKALK